LLYVDEKKGDGRFKVHDPRRVSLGVAGDLMLFRLIRSTAITTLQWFVTPNYN
jgi:hypothetical protein